MTKIQNWSLNKSLTAKYMSKKSSRRTWDNDKLPIRVQVKQRYAKSEYEVNLKKLTGDGGDLILTTLKGRINSRSDAIDYARKWARDHPNGPEGLKIDVRLQ